MAAYIDLRSDTVTRPSEEMRLAMYRAEVGDDVYGEDPTVNALEELAAEKLNSEFALFVSSGTQSNLLALMSHCRRGEEYIVGQDAHTYKYEAGGAAVLGSIQPQPVDFEEDGTLDLKKVEEVIKPDDFHFAQARLLCLENTKSGKVLPMEYLKQASDFVAEKNLNLHLDGARIFNAAVELNVDVSRISTFFDSVSVCLSKGLGAPVGSVLCGNRDFIRSALKWRKMLGGGMRQAGILAAAGIFALENNVNRLAEDHENAEILAGGLSRIDGITVEDGKARTNMVFISVDPAVSADLTDYLKERGILISPRPVIRLVTHLNVSREDIHKVVEAFEHYFSRK